MDRYVEPIFLNNKSNNEMSSTIIKLHPEEYGNSKLNSAIEAGFEDINRIDIIVKDLGEKVENLLNKTVNRLDEVASIINSEKERLQDISMLCNEKTDYDNVIPLSDYHFTGNYSYDDGVFSAKHVNSSSTESIIKEVAGNGYEGNKYVKRENSYLENTIKTSTRKYAVDNDISTYWEYSRITASNTEEYLISDFNTDSSEAKCTVTLKFDQLTNEIAIKSTLEGIKVISIKYSKEDTNYQDLKILPFTLNNREDCYKNDGYIYGSNIIAFPDSLYVKITFESMGYLDETISFQRVVYDNNKTSEVTTIVPSAKRHVVRLNNIISKRKNYLEKSIFKSNELIVNKNDIYAISIFANIFLPNNMPQDYVTFTLTVNGVDYDIKPINSYSNGTKIIRFSQGKVPIENTKYIGEKITSAFLTVSIKSKNNLTPYINNLKILLGGEV